MSEFIVVLKSKAEVAGAVRVEADSELEAFNKAKEKAENGSISWVSPEIDTETISNFRVTKIL